MSNEIKMPIGKYLATVKIGPKGQIVLPKEVRDIFGLAPGDSLLLLADADRGIALNTIDYFNRVADAAFASDTVDREKKDFAGAVHSVTDNPPEKPAEN